LEKDVKENHSARLIDRAKKFGVRPSARYYALKEKQIKKRNALPGKKPPRKNEILYIVVSNKKETLKPSQTLTVSVFECLTLS
jgi:putative transposase